MKTNTLWTSTATALIAVAMAACSGGDMNFRLNGGANPIGPGWPPVQGNEAIIAHGEITGLGGITLNDVRYQAGTASVVVNGNAASLSDLRQGYIVTLSGRINDDGRDGIAEHVRFDANIIGPVDGMDAPNGQLVIMGQTVASDADTHFGAGIDPATYAGLAIGDLVQVSGYADGSGSILATRIDTAPANADLQLIGTVTDLDLANLQFRINRLTVDYSSALVVDLPGGAPATAMRVKVFGTMAAGRFAVERLISAPALAGNTGQRVQTAGYVTRFNSAADFDVDHFGIRSNAGTAYRNGTASNLALNAAVVIDGKFASNGLVAADHITFGHVAVSTDRLTFGFRDFTEISVPTVFAVSVYQGADYAVEVFVDRGHENRIDVTQNGSRLSIELLPGDGNIHTLEAVITMPVLARIDLSGVAFARLYDFEQAQMIINVGGVSFLRAHGLRIGNLTAAVSGVSRMDLVDVRPIGNAHVTISGVSQATLNMDVGATLTGSVQTGRGTGASTLFYYGTNVDVNVTSDRLSSIVRLGATRP